MVDDDCVGWEFSSGRRKISSCHVIQLELPSIRQGIRQMSFAKICARTIKGDDAEHVVQPLPVPDPVCVLSSCKTRVVVS